MNPIFPELPVDLGVYTLTQLLGSHETRDRYLARQSHVERSVVIEVLRPGCPKETLDAFLRSARVRVAARLPQVSQVLETMVSGNIWYITLECPEGVPLSRLIERGKHLSTVQACAVIQRAADLYDHCDRQNLAAEALTPDAVYVNGEGGVTFLSPLIAGVPSPELHAQQLDGLCATLQNVSPEGEAGQTRVATLLSWLVQEFDNQRMEWQAVSSTAEYITENVAPADAKEKARTHVVETPYMRKRRWCQRRRFFRKYWPVAVLCLAVAVAISTLGCFISPYFFGEYIPAIREDYVCCRTQDGKVAVMSSPVTIREYQIFLDDYEKMSAKKKNALNKGLPPGDYDHKPAEWAQQIRAACSVFQWQGRELSLHSPVRGVSYWNAVAFANYRNASLPTLDQLLTVRRAIGNRTCEEWTSSPYPEHLIYEKSNVVLPAEKDTLPIPESDLHKKDNNRSFRIVLPTIPRHKS